MCLITKKEIYALSHYNSLLASRMGVKVIAVYLKSTFSKQTLWQDHIHYCGNSKSDFSHIDFFSSGSVHLKYVLKTCITLELKNVESIANT